jgi:hypothetical protein
MSKNKLLKRLLRPRAGKLTGKWRILFNAGLINYYESDKVKSDITVGTVFK